MQRRAAPLRRVGWVTLLFAVTAGLVEVRYINWWPILPPVDTRPLVIRSDAKGDGQFHARRSGNRRHSGIDLAAPLRSPVRAMRAGRVRRADRHPGRGFYVDLDHGDGLTSRYAHLTETRVQKGVRVRQGTVIGTVGKTGNAEHPAIDPHVHFEVRRDDAPIDPITLGLTIGDAHVAAESITHASGGE